MDLSLPVAAEPLLQVLSFICQFAGSPSQTIEMPGREDMLTVQ